MKQEFVQVTGCLITGFASKDYVITSKLRDCKRKYQAKKREETKKKEAKNETI